MRYDKKQLNVYRGVLNNKNLAKVLEDALTAPVGSTKRKQAQKTLSVIRKATIDGKGGPGPRVPRVNLQLKPNVVDYSNFLILPPTPKVRVPIGEKAPTPKPYVHDGQGYTPLPPGLGAPMGQTTTQSAPADWNKVRQNIVGAASGAYNVGSSLLRNSSNLNPWGAVTAPLRAAMGSVTSRTSQDPAFSTSQSSPLMTNLKTSAPAASATTPMWGLGANAKQMSVSGNQVPTQQTTTTPQSGQMQGPQQPQTPTTQSGGANATVGGTELTTGFQVPQYAGIQDALIRGTGPTMFAYGALSRGGDYLKSLEPNASKTMLEGGGLYDRLIKIEESTRKALGLDQIKDQLNSMVMSGQTLEGRLTDYIRGRDEFLNDTEDMISDLKRSSMKMDMSDPRTQSNMQQHFNYLYELRGRQNKRYIEFLDMSIDAYQGKIDRVKNMYDTTFAEYEQRVTQNQEILKEEYNMMFTGLQEMYNEAADAERKALELEAMRIQNYGANVQILRDGYDAAGVSSGDPVELSKALKSLGVIGENNEWVPNNNALSLSGANVYRLPELIDEGVGHAMWVTDKDGNKTPVSRDRAFYVVQNALGHLMQLNAAGIIVGDEYARREANIKGHLSRYLTNNSNFLDSATLPSYRKAIESLAGDGFIFNRSTPEKSKFIAKWGSAGEGLDDQLLTTIYDSMSGFRNGREFVDTFLYQRGELGQKGAMLSDDQLKQELIESYMFKLQPQAISGSFNFNQVGGGTNSASIRKAAQAIANIESSGGNYSAKGPVTASGDRAYGKYQVMGANIPSWTKSALGYSLTPEQFLSNPQAQEAVFAHIFGGYMSQYGPDNAASMWFSGRPIAEAGNATDILGTSVPNYVRKFQQYYYS